jgi:hypothetical protein
MAKNDLLKEAIADAKAVRETALANAKIALEEAFTPRIQSMLSAKLSEEEEMGMEEDEEMNAPVEEPVAEMEDAYSEDEVSEEEEMAAPEMEEPAAEEPVAEEEDLELEAIIKELEDEMAVEEELDSTDIGNGDNKMDAATADTEDPGEGDLTEEEEVEAELAAEGEDEMSIDEIIKALREDEGEEEVTVTEEEEASSAEDLEEAYKVIKFLRSKINEVNLLNAKLLFSNKLFRNHSLNEGQKMKVIENFDRAQTLREVKLVFTTLAESFNLNGSRTKRTIKESYASKATRSTKPSKSVITEGTDLAARWKKLANL